MTDLVLRLLNQNNTLDTPGLFAGGKITGQSGFERRQTRIESRILYIRTGKDPAAGRGQSNA
jgi:hypothetical protein